LCQRITPAAMALLTYRRRAQPVPPSRFLHARQRLSWRLAGYDRRVHGRGPLLVAIGDSLTDPCSGSTFPWQVWLRRVARCGYKTVNLGVSGDTTADMRRRIEQTVGEGQPEIVVLFGGANDAFRGVDPEETELNVTLMVHWLREQGVRKIVLIGPGPPNWGRDANWAKGIEQVRAVLRGVAERHGAIFLDLDRFLRAWIEHSEHPNFSRLQYRRSRSWYVQDGDPHFNAYGQRLIAKAFLAATADWRQ
jgi:lysophospholipase L1-like esterase